MRVVVIGGTTFIGRRIVEDLVARGDDVVVVHRGVTEPDDLVTCRHVHATRAQFASVAGEVRGFAPDAIIDTLAMTRADIDDVLAHLPDTQIVMLSSVDVYEAFWLVLNDREGEPVPLDESARLRHIRYPYRQDGRRPDDYDKLDVEPSYLERGATVLRLAMIYGEHDPQRREEFILRRVRAARRRIPVGPGSWLWTRCYVGDVSAAVLATLGNARAAGEVFNIGEPVVRSIRGWAGEILAAAGHDAELVTVPDPVLPSDMELTRTYGQHLVLDASKAADVLGWRATSASEPGPSSGLVPSGPVPSGPVPSGLVRSVRWHLSHPPAGADPDFSADDTALAAA